MLHNIKRTLATSWKLMLLTGHYKKSFIEHGGAELQLVPWPSVGSPSFEVSKAVANPAHDNCSASSGRLDKTQSEIPLTPLFCRECLQSTNLKKCNPICKPVLCLFYQTNSGDVSFYRLQLSGELLVIFIQMHPGLQAQIIHVYGE